MTGSVLNENKVEDLVFCVRRKWMIRVLNGNKPQKDFVPVGCSLCRMSKVSASEGKNISELSPHELGPGNEFLLGWEIRSWCCG
jgi:hypothetical protein